MSLQNYLTNAKDCLAAGRMSEMRLWLRRAETSASLEEESNEVRILALRCCLATGQYELGQRLLAEAEGQEILSSSVGPLRKALFSAAGWGPLPAEAPADMFALVVDLVHGQALDPERILTELGAWSRLVPSHPLWLERLAARPFPAEAWAGLGQRVLPPNAEAALAELWYGAGGQGEYPRRALLEENEAEGGFSFLPAFCDLLQALSQENIHAALAASDRLFSVAEEGRWLWLRTLDLLRHFGEPETFTRTLLRLRNARRVLQSSFSSSSECAPLEEYSALVHSFTQTIVRCSPIGFTSSSADEGTSSPADKSQALEELFPLTASVASPPWFAAPSACLMVNRLLESFQAKSLPLPSAFPDLLPLHEFVRSALHTEASAAAQWLALSPSWQMEKAYAALLLKALPSAPEEVALACVPILRNQGMTLGFVLPSLPPGARATVFAREPEPSGLVTIASLPEETLWGMWPALTEAVWTLGGQKLKSSERAAQEKILRRLTPFLEKPTPGPLPDETLVSLAEWAGVRPAASKAEENLLCRLGEQLADAQKWDAAARVLEQAGEAGASLRGEVTARQWLATGQTAAYQPDLWHSPGPWCEMALAWQDLLGLRPATLSETNPLRTEQADLALAWDALVAWRDDCLASDEIKPFTQVVLFDRITEHWQFLRSLRAWRLLTSSADVLPPIAGITPGPECPLLSLLRLVRYGMDTAAMRVVLPPLHTYEPLPASLILRLLEQAVKSAGKPEAVRSDLHDLLTSHMTDAIRAALPPAMVLRLDALPLALASTEAHKLLRLDQAKETEKRIRLTLQKLEVMDFQLTPILEKMGDFVTGPHFHAWSIPQWEMIRRWRRSLEAQDEEFRNQVRGALPENHSLILSRLLFARLRPAMIDGSNVLRDKKTVQQFEWSTDCLENLWAGLSAEGFYPILTYVDRNEFFEQESAHGLEGKRRLNELIRNGFIDDDAVIEDGPADPNTSKIGDYRILCHIQRESWQESALIITNDDYSKQRRKPTDTYGPHFFSWLTKSAFGQMQAKFRYNEGQWFLRLPNGQEVPF
jgi:hypothetical protein